MRSIIFLFFGTVLLFGKLHIATSIPPIATLIEKIGSGEVVAYTMIPKGVSPHTYEPKPSQMRELRDMDAYMKIGVEFEKIWVPRFCASAKKMEVVDLSSGISRIRRDDPNEPTDPHIWTSYENLTILTDEIARSLCRLDKDSCKMYQNSAISVKQNIKEQKQQSEELLAKADTKLSFLSIHPSWSYFAREFNITQISVEKDGKDPSAKELIGIINRAKKLKTKLLVVEPEASSIFVKTLKSQLELKILTLSPLGTDILHTLHTLTTNLAKTEE